MIGAWICATFLLVVLGSLGFAYKLTAREQFQERCPALQELYGVGFINEHSRDMRRCELEEGHDGPHHWKGKWW